MKIGGLQRFSLIDYPGKVSAVIFTQGCNFRCPFCHNPQLVIPRKFEPALSHEMIFSFLRKRKNQLQGIVITGGEPTCHDDLLDFVVRIKKMGFLVKLDTNGSNPLILSALLSRKLIDYVAMDIKAPLHKYESLAGVAIHLEDIRKSIDLLMTSGIDYNFRTTVVPGLLDEKDLLDISILIKGSKHYVRQEFVGSENILDPRIRVTNSQEKSV